MMVEFMSHALMNTQIKILFYLERKRKREREKEREKHTTPCIMHGIQTSEMLVLSLVRH